MAGFLGALWWVSIFAALASAFEAHKRRENAIRQLPEEVRDKARDIRVVLTNSLCYIGLSITGVAVVAKPLANVGVWPTIVVVLLGAGALGWLWHRRAKNQLTEMDLPAPCPEGLISAHILYALAVGVFAMGIVFALLRS